MLQKLCLSTPMSVYTTLHHCLFTPLPVCLHHCLSTLHYCLSTLLPVRLHHCPSTPLSVYTTVRLHPCLSTLHYTTVCLHYCKHWFLFCHSETEWMLFSYFNFNNVGNHLNKIILISNNIWSISK